MYVCMYMYACLYLRMCVCIDACMYLHMCVCIGMHVCIDVCILVNINNIYIYTYMGTSMWRGPGHPTKIKPMGTKIFFLDMIIFRNCVLVLAADLPGCASRGKSWSTRMQAHLVSELCSTTAAWLVCSGMVTAFSSEVIGKKCATARWCFGIQLRFVTCDFTFLVCGFVFGLVTPLYPLVNRRILCF